MTTLYSKLSFLLNILLIASVGAMELEVKQTLPHTTTVSIEQEVAQLLREYPDSKGRSPLMIAACKGNIEIARVLIERHGACLQAKIEPHGFTALMLAVVNNHKHMVQFLIEKGANIETTAHCGAPALFFAAGINTDMFEFLINQCGAKLNIASSNGTTPLMYAIKHKALPKIKLLVEKYHVALDDVDGEGNNALYHAIKEGQLDIIQFLILKGATLSARRINAGHTPLMVAACYKSAQVVEFLIDRHYYDLTATTPKGTNLVMAAAREGQLSIVKLLVEKYKMPLSTLDIYGFTPLHYAVMGGNVDLVQYLIHKGADIHAKNNQRITPLNLALRTTSIGIAKLLLNTGASLKEGMSNPEQWTTAITVADTPLVARLIHSSNPAYMDYCYSTCLQQLVTHPYPHAVQLLKSFHEQPEFKNYMSNRARYVQNYLNNLFEHTCPPPSLLNKAKYTFKSIFDHTTQAQRHCSGYKRTRLHQTPFMWACMSNDIKTVKIFIDFSPAWFLNAQDVFGCTVLMYAALCERPHVMELLLKCPAIQANINKRSKEQYSALDYAVISSSLKMVRTLLENGALPTSYTVHAASHNNRSRLAAELLVKKLIGTDLVNSTENY